MLPLIARSQKQKGHVCLPAEKGSEICLSDLGICFPLCHAPD